MKKISSQFAFLMAAAAVVPLLAYGAVSIYSLRTGGEQAVVQGNLNVARRAAEQINLYITGSVKILKAVAADLQQTGLEHWQQDRILKNFVLQFPEFRELTLLDESGHPTVSSSLGTPTAQVPGSEGVDIEGALMSSFSVDDDLLPTAVVAVRLSERGSTGWLVGRLNLEELWRMVDRIRVGQQGYALVLTKEGRLLAHGNPSAKSRVARGDSLTRHPLVLALASEPANGTTTTQYTDQAGPVLGVASRLRGLDWTIIVEQPTVEAFAIPNRMQQQLFVAIAGVLLVMLTIGYLWGRNFLTPILALTRSTQRLASGKMDERVAVTSVDEIGQLGDAFNNMADRLVELQEDVRKTERQATFGRVAMGLVHDLANPIQNLGNACKMIVKAFDDQDYRESFKRTVDRELAVIKRMLDDLRNIAKPLPLERFPLDVNKALGELAESMQSGAATSGLTLATDLTDGPLVIDGDLFALNRVYRNLVTNAFQATPPHGTVTIRTRHLDGDAVIEIADTGCGIPPDRLETIFDDFVTTKRRGLGLGLAISKKVVDQLGGRITVESVVNQGTTFSIRFPVSSSRPAPVDA